PCLVLPRACLHRRLPSPAPLRAGTASFSPASLPRGRSSPPSFVAATTFCTIGDCRRSSGRLTTVFAMTQLSRRHDAILDALAQRGYVSIDQLVATLQVTPQTLRR